MAGTVAGQETKTCDRLPAPAERCQSTPACSPGAEWRTWCRRPRARCKGASLLEDVVEQQDGRGEEDEVVGRGQGDPGGVSLEGAPGEQMVGRLDGRQRHGDGGGEEQERQGEVAAPGARGEGGGQ